MKTLFILMLVLVCFQMSKAQDLIVTQKGDSLNCNITRIRSDYIHFTFKHENEIRNTLLPVSEIKFYKEGFFSKAEVPPDKIKNVEGDYQKVRFGIYGGWSYRTAKIHQDVPDVLREFAKEMKSGYHLGADFTYFTSESFGFGVRYSRFGSANELNNVSTTYKNTNQKRTGTLKDEVGIHYFGPAICARTTSANQMRHFIADFSLGYLSYKEEIVFIDRFTLTGGTVGVMLNLGFDFALDKNLSLGIFLAYTAGALSEVNFNNGIQTQKIKLKNDELEGLSRIDISVGLRWNK